MTKQVNDGAPRHFADDDDAGGGFDGFLVWNALRYWWRFALPIAVVLAASAAGAVAYFSKPQFTAAAWLIIREKPEYLLNPQVMEDPRKFVQNQLELMRSPPVLDPVANQPQVFATPELAGGDPAEQLRRLLKVHAQGQSDFFVIEFTSQSPVKAAIIVNEIAKAYLLLQDREQASRMEATITRLEKQRADQQQLIERLRDQVQDKSKSLTGVDPYAMKGAAGQLRVLDALSPLQSQIVSAEIDQAMAEAQVEAEEELLKKQEFQAPALEIEQRVHSLPEIVALRRRIGEAQGLAQEHERTSVNLTKNTRYQQIVQQKNADEQRLAKRLDELRDLVAKEMESVARLKRSDEIVSLRKTLEAKKRAVEILRERMQKERANQQVYKGETVELEFLRADYEGAARVFEAINDRIVSMRLEQHAPDRVLLFKEAVAPTVPDRTLPYKHMALAAAMACALPFGIALGIEMFHRRVSSRRQLEVASRIPVVAEVTSMPRLLSSKGRNDPNRDLQLFEESIFGLRTHLLLSKASAPFKTLAVTSGISGEGKTSVAVQLAISIARSTDQPTLLIDGDLRCPDVHRVFGINRSPGLAELLRGALPAHLAIETSYDEMLHVLPAGRTGAVPHRLFGGTAFPELLTQLSKRYQFIVIDTPPILPASEALIMARAADATVLCARRDFSRMEQVLEACSRLKSAGVELAGTVLNGIPPASYAYRYGAYYSAEQDQEAAALADD
jgi:polysaccharide biosynthesis transport protein